MNSEKVQPITWADIVEMYKKISAPRAPTIIMVRPELYADAVEMFGARCVVESSYIPEGVGYVVQDPEAKEHA